MADICLKRLRKEYRDIKKNPVDNIRAAPLENNTLEWHYVIEGVKGSVYEGGWYHGVLLFPKEYPYKPPSVIMYTPNGRFQERVRLCLSMSDFHPELWNTSWSVSTILIGLHSFMMEETPTAGSVVTSSRMKRAYAAKSLAFNCKDKNFCALFPELVELYEAQQEALGKEDSDKVMALNTDEPVSGWENLIRRIPFWAVLIAIISLFSAAIYIDII
mmetsp:Transcript_20249/g.29071  ORF Transcript_20249/g.29071 Transcript_20249/m.29071 type:complete len:216 (-) Transcript_20249:189-836(-)